MIKMSTGLKKLFLMASLFVLCECSTRRHDSLDSTNSGKDLPRLSAYLEHYFRIGLLDLNEFGGKEKIGIDFKKVSKDTKSKFFVKLYKEWIKSRGEKVQDFFLTELPDFALMDSKHRPPLYYNQFAFGHGANKDKINYVFRPIEVDTGCMSQCRHVVFHLVFDFKTKKAIDFIEEKNRPLTKIFHQPFSIEDKKQLRSLLTNKPKEFENIMSPPETTFEVSTSHSQTWTYLQPSVVPGAAYTSFRVLEAEDKTSDWLKLNDSSDIQTKDLRPQLNSILSKSLEEPVSLQDMEENLIQIFNDSSTPKEAKQMIQRLLLVMKLWNIESFRGDYRLGELEDDFAKVSTSFSCSLLFDLTWSSPGRKMLLDFGQKRIEKLCPIFEFITFKGIYEFLENGKEFKPEIGGAMPQFIRRLPPEFWMGYLENVAKVSHEAHNRSFADHFADQIEEFKFQNPLADISNLAKAANLPEDFWQSQKRGPRYNVKGSSDGYSQVHGSLAKLRINSPLDEFSLKNLLKDQKNKDSKVALVFFLFSCPHCHDLYSEFSSLPASLDKSKLVWIHLGHDARDFSWRSGFCKNIASAKNNCEAPTLQIDLSKPETRRLVDQIDLRGAPHVAIINGAGEVLEKNIDLLVTKTPPFRKRKWGSPSKMDLLQLKIR